MEVAGAHGSVDELSKMSYTGFGDHRRAAWAVGGDGAVMTGKVSTLQIAKAGSAIA
jgi:hypothetical protein